MHYKSGFGQRYRSSASPASEFKKRSRYIPKLLTQKAHIRSGLGPASARHNIINLHVETWLCIKGLRHKMVLLKSHRDLRRSLLIPGFSIPAIVEE
jgi:hypothetical protein